MSKGKKEQLAIQVCANWAGIENPQIMGTLFAAVTRGKEIFSFEYDTAWLKSPYAQEIDPNLRLYTGPQYPKEDHANFGLFLDSSPDRWGRVLMQRREAQRAREEGRQPINLQQSDYLLGVYDGHRIGAIRFRLSSDGPFLDNNADLASPPWVRLRELENASLQLEKEGAEDDVEYSKWLKMLIAPGGSLGGARPKASIMDENGQLWIAKFPSRKDDRNMGGWEFVMHQMAIDAGIDTAPAKAQRFSGEYDTFITKRFDRTAASKRVHFASAMTMLGKQDGDGADTDVSYLDIAEFLIRNGSQADKDLEELWRRIVFNICASNTDDHLRNHGFLLQQKGWVLSPAYDMNPNPNGDGLTLNIDKTDNSQDLDIAMEVASFFRIKDERANQIVSTVKKSLHNWRDLAQKKNIPAKEIELMSGAFRL